MGQVQYRETLLLKLREWRLSNPEDGLSEARREMRRMLTKKDVDHLFDNWINKNFDRIEIHQSGGSLVAEVRPYRKSVPKRRGEESALIDRAIRGIKSNLYAEFSARIWDTVLPNGVILRDAKGSDMKHAGGWYAALAKSMKPSEKVVKRFTTKQLFDVSQRKTFTVA